MSASGQLGALIGGLSPDKRALLADLLRPTSEPIAIIGMSCRFPGGIDSPDALWDLLRDGRTVIDDLSHERWDLDLIDSRPDGLDEPPRRRGALLGLSDVADFDTSFFGIPPSEASRMDPQQRIALEVAWETLEHAGLAVDKLAGSASGVFVGISDTLYALGELRADPQASQIRRFHSEPRAALPSDVSRISSTCADQRWHRYGMLIVAGGVGHGVPEPAQPCLRPGPGWRGLRRRRARRVHRQLHDGHAVARRTLQDLRRSRRRLRIWRGLRHAGAQAPVGCRGRR